MHAHVVACTLLAFTSEFHQN